MNLSKRLETILQMVDRCDTVADIGTDHAFIPIRLVAGGIAKSAIATDIHEGPVEIARRHIADQCLSERICVRLGDGLSVLKPHEADTIIITGIGGLLMERILREHVEVLKSARTVLLSPHSDHAAVRRFLAEEGFVFLDERAVTEEDKYYVILKVRPGETPYALTEEEAEFGPLILKERPAEFRQYIAHRIEVLESILKTLVSQGGGKSLAAYREKKEERDRYRNWL